jgi:hypothetical protein
LRIPMADGRLAGIAVADIGETALGIFKRGNEFVGKTVSIAADHLTGAQYAAAMSEALSEEVLYRPYGWDEYRELGFPGAVEFGNMFPVLRRELRTFHRRPRPHASPRAQPATAVLPRLAHHTQARTSTVLNGRTGQPEATNRLKRLHEKLGRTASSTVLGAPSAGTMAILAVAGSGHKHPCDKWTRVLAHIQPFPVQISVHAINEQIDRWR